MYKYLSDKINVMYEHISDRKNRLNKSWVLFTSIVEQVCTITESKKIMGGHVRTKIDKRLKTFYYTIGFLDTHHQSF